MRVAVLALALSAFLTAQPAGTFSPPRIIRADLPDFPAPNVVGGGEVLIEATIDRSGLLTRPVLIRSTPPYTDLILSAVSQWRFQPAKASNGRDPEIAVEAQVAIAAVFRPPTLFNGPTLGEAPKELGVASGDVAYPSALIAPAYPPKALNPGLVLFEVLLDDNGGIVEALPIASDPAFESAARDALTQSTFRPGSHRGRPAPATAYVLFGFRSPVVSSGPRLPLIPPPRRQTLPTR